MVRSEHQGDSTDETVGNKHGLKKQLSSLKEQCHEDIAVLGQFCANTITLRL